MTYAVGDHIRFWEEKRAYTVQAAGLRYLVCTKPFFKTVLYTVVDLVHRVRGTENLVFGAGAETRQDCEEMLARLESGETEISRRNVILLNLKEKK